MQEGQAPTSTSRRHEARSTPAPARRHHLPLRRDLRSGSRPAHTGKRQRERVAPIFLAASRVDIEPSAREACVERRWTDRCPEQDPGDRLERDDGQCRRLRSVASSPKLLDVCQATAVAKPSEELSVPQRGRVLSYARRCNFPSPPDEKNHLGGSGLANLFVKLAQTLWLLEGALKCACALMRHGTTSKPDR